MNSKIQGERMKRAISSVFVIIVLLSGCIPAQRAAFNPALRSQIKSIGILTIYNPMSYDTLDLSGQEGVAGLLGPASVIGARAREDRKNQFQTMMMSSGLDFGKAFTEGLKKELQSAGYLVVDIPATRNNSKELVKDYSNLGSNVDAYLDITTPFIGYNCNDKAFSRRYKPRVIVHANLIRSKTKELTYSELINYGDKSSSDCVYFAVSEEYQYEKFEDLLKGKAVFLKGMNEGISKIASQIAKDLSS
jgi:hypothetical protein